MDEWALILNDRIIKRFYIEDGQSLTIGRGNESDVVVDNTAISRQHCTLELKNETYYLTDLYSLNGTKVNGKKIKLGKNFRIGHVRTVNQYDLVVWLELEADSKIDFSIETKN